ncbi:MAG: D-tyrosyl-tRNA(Tyr) deacylase [Erysipelotrichaceae bacterium]|nr:D-tyrosyl-tRNA(Tyr) deacylase [Erysipelotrichaceae bacterium]
MRVVVQRVKQASVTIDNEVFNEVKEGFLLLVGITEGDNEEIATKVANKVIDLRIFEDEQGKMNKSIEDIGGSVLSISQFTLYADVKKGRRPSFVKAARPEVANPLYEYFNEKIRARGIACKPGVFGADMKVELLNDGPVTIIVDSEEL